MQGRWLIVCALAAAPAPAAAATPGVVIQQGEIIVMEGDAEIVGGAAGARALEEANAVALLDRFYQHYPDEFDMVVVWMTWADAANGGAYYSSGVPTPSLRSFGFVNMNQVGFWDDFVIPVIAQEFSHAWLVDSAFVDPVSGQVSDELLGRQGAHWSALVDAEGSVQDGVDWDDNGDGTFTVVGYMNKWSPLDLWYMGFVDKSEVPPFFVLRDAVTEGGMSLGPLSTPNVGTTVTATRVPVTIQDVIAASGDQPPVDERQKEFRLAFVLVTDIGESAQAAVGTAEELDRIRTAWDEQAVLWLLGRGSMCTDTTAPCNVPHARFVAGRFVEAPAGDGDGVVEPGEPALAEVTFRNTGLGVASGATASLEPADARWPAPADVALADLEPGRDGVARFELDLPADAACGERARFTATSHVDLRQWSGELVLIPGVVEGPIERFASNASWRADAGDTDTAMSGGWDWGVAEKTEYDGRVLQPDGGAGGATDPAWWTGKAAGFDWKANDVDTGVTTLTSADVDLAGLHRPSVRYSVWYVATSINTGAPVPTDGDELVVEASKDGGQTWVEVDRVAGEPRAWERREASLDAVAGAAPVRLRFTARDQGPEQNLVEVGLDDVQLVSLSPACAGGDGGGCGCRVGSRRGPGPAAAVLALGLLGLVRARRRRRPR